ncbi:hypothetical protein D7V86_16925 [bacterium D16-51]|nr:hypothetical protein D7V96_11980 [bacterium D16-59]RKI57697.1 hypothetical protein D7V86_16925 [bacterium D16-51]
MSKAAEQESVLCGDSLNDLEESMQYNEKEEIEKMLKEPEGLSEAQIEDLKEKQKIVNNSLLENKLYVDAKTNNLDIVPDISAFAAGDRDVDKDRILLNMTQCEQKNSYYCGPATTRQTLLWINGSAPSQDKIAEGIGTTKDGTDGTKIVPYLNKKQKKRVYVISDSIDAVTIKSRIVTAISSADAVPVIARLKFDKGGDWEHETRGHYLNIAGYTTGMKKVYLTDPNITRVDPKAAGTYMVSFNSLHAAIKAHWTHHIYW